jgi:PPOX class probable FMN-dependent enzyme
MGDDRITTLEELRDVVAAPDPGIELKIGDHVDAHAAAFIAESPFVVMATSDADGRLDASPKGDEPGFVVVEDEHTLLLPDRPGNHLAMGLQNIVSNPRIGVLFVIPGTTETLRVNGRATLHRDPALLERLAARGKPAVLVIRIEVEEVFFHCAKAFIRSKLWKHEQWPPKKKISFGSMFAEKLAPAEPDAALAAAIDEAVNEDYEVNL